MSELEHVDGYKRIKTYNYLPLRVLADIMKLISYSASGHYITNVKKRFLVFFYIFAIFGYWFVVA